uniref:Nuclear receptor domain-containing protein n=1 Tax=Caenorhabditis tropicalis TaxID=1561998 RepID=A0A1I7US78_9PELO
MCREDLSKKNTASCICEKCYGMSGSDVMYPDNDGFEQSQINFDRPSSSSSSSSSWPMNQRGQDDLYPSQNSYNGDQN